MKEVVKTLIQEDNVISLRTALILDNGDTVSLQLTPAWMRSSIPGAKPQGLDWASQDFTWLYRHKRPWLEEQKLKRIYPGIVQQDLKPLIFKQAPEFKLLWTASGDSVALILNGELWAFIDEQTHTGYSKGILKSPDVSPWRKSEQKPICPMSWNQDLYDKVFSAK